MINIKQEFDITNYFMRGWIVNGRIDYNNNDSFIYPSNVICIFNGTANTIYW